MSSDMLMIASLIMVSIALICAVLTSLYDRRCSEKIQVNAKLRHGSNSPLSMSTMGKVSVFLLYSTAAYSSDIAFEWLASIALVTCFLGIVVDRIITYIMTKRNITPSDPAPKADARQAAMDHGEPVPEPIGEMLINIGGIVVTLCVWAALISLIMLLAFSLIEVVIPHYMLALEVIS